jgi:hypothetical protein
MHHVDLSLLSLLTSKHLGIAGRHYSLIVAHRNHLMIIVLLDNITIVAVMLRATRIVGHLSSSSSSTSSSASTELISCQSEGSAMISPLNESVTIKTIEMHTAGEPVRIVASGYPMIHGNTILEQRRYAREFLDHYRRLCMFEPRGHDGMYGVIPVKPTNDKAQLAVLFCHNEGYSTMCGHV